MLEHEDKSQSTSQSDQPKPISRSEAESARVTAEEFTSALRAIEERQANESAHHAGTVALGETIRELNIDATPEQILAEVLAERARKADQNRAKSDLKDKAKKTASDAWDYASAAASTIRQRIEEAQQSEHNNSGPGIQVHVNVGAPSLRVRSRFRIGKWLILGFIAWAVWSGLTGHHGVGITIGNPSGSDTPGAIVALDKVPSGQTVYCDTSDLATIIKDGGTTSGAAGTVQTMSHALDNTWPIVVHNGNVYLSGFTATKSVGSVTAGPVDILNDDNSGELYGVSDTAVTIPVDGAELISQRVDDGWSELTLDHVKIDEFTQEKDE